MSQSLASVVVRRSRSASLGGLKTYNNLANLTFEVPKHDFMLVESVSKSLRMTIFTSIHCTEMNVGKLTPLTVKVIVFSGRARACQQLDRVSNIKGPRLNYATALHAMNIRLKPT